MIISRTPVRLSFFGGGTDYPEYFARKPCAVMGTTINQYSYITVNRLTPFFDYKIKVSYSKTEIVQNAGDLVHPSVRETLKYIGSDEPLDIHYFADLPAKTGLGSSSSFTVGLLNALHALGGKFTSRGQLAREAIEIEQKRIGENVGIQDQIHAAHGGLNVIRAQGDHWDVSPVICCPEKRQLLDESLMLFYTGLTRFASEVVEEQLEKTKTLSLDDYLVRMTEQVDDAQDILNRASGTDMLSQFGKLMHEGWTLKKQLSSKISNDFIDGYYRKALDAGAFGGKIGGAGGGGFLMLIVAPEQQNNVRAALKDLLEVKFRFDNTGSTIIYSI